MASRSWKLGSSKNKTRRAKETFLGLPSDLLQLIISRLPLKDNIRASTVCKTLHDACVSVRVVDKSPWLIRFYEANGLCKLYDPSMQKTNNLKFPELSGFRVCHSKDGWLLMNNATSRQILFFNPFTRDRIPVPPHWMENDQRMAFSCAPTSTSCLLFTVDASFTYITVKTCCPNAKEWNKFVFRNRLPHNYKTYEQIVFSNGVFYCLTDTRCLWMFDPSLNSWNVLPGRPLRRPGSNGCFMTEHQGEIFLIYMYNHMKPAVLKLVRTSWGLTERITLGGLTIYPSALSSESRAQQKLPSGFKRPCIYYKFDEESTSCFWNKRDLYHNIWIMPPLNLLDLPFD